MKYLGILSLLAIILCCNCSSDNADTPLPDDGDKNRPEQKTEWAQRADAATTSLITHFWNTQEGYFNYQNDMPDGSDRAWSYWPQAHALDVVIDAYTRTKDAKYRDYLNKWYLGVKKKSGNSYYNDFYDDMEWITLTMIRMYQCTNDTRFLNTAQDLWNKIKGGWNDKGGGGIAWKQSQLESKNACSNGPAGLIACFMYNINHKEEDKEWAIKIYDWLHNTLFNSSTGAVYDNINGNTGNIQKNWIFTYNQGTFLGLAHELYKITGEENYLGCATLAAEYTLKHLVDSSKGILKSEGTGDGGLFKGIFIRYFVKLIFEKDLTEKNRIWFADFLIGNAKILWNNCNAADPLFDADWSKKVNSAELGTHVSGCMLLEATAYYDFLFSHHP